MTPMLFVATGNRENVPLRRAAKLLGRRDAYPADNRGPKTVVLCGRETVVPHFGGKPAGYAVPAYSLEGHWVSSEGDFVPMGLCRLHGACPDANGHCPKQCFNKPIEKAAA